jgi:hypothetical protein
LSFALEREREREERENIAASVCVYRSQRGKQYVILNLKGVMIQPSYGFRMVVYVWGVRSTLGLRVRVREDGRREGDVSNFEINPYFKKIKNKKRFF